MQAIHTGTVTRILARLRTAVGLMMICHALPAAAVGIDLGSNAGYALVFLAPGGVLHVNSGPITGDVLAGNGATVTSSGGGNGEVIGRFFVDGTVSGNLLANLQTPEAAITVSPAVAQTALNDALAAKSAANALSATQTFGSITGVTAITGNGGMNVIEVDRLHDAELTLTGNASDYFVFNVEEQVHTNRAMTLNGVLPTNILWNLNGTGTVFQTSGGSVLYGTFLTTTGDYQFSGLDLTGRLINAGGDIQFVSNSAMALAVPEPSPAALLVFGIAGLALVRRRALCRARGATHHSSTASPSPV